MRQFRCGYRRTIRLRCAARQNRRLQGGSLQAGCTYDPIGSIGIGSRSPIRTYAYAIDPDSTGPTSKRSAAYREDISTSGTSNYKENYTDWRESDAADNWGDGNSEPSEYWPDITILTEAEKGAVLPLLPSSEQVQWLNDDSQLPLQVMTGLLIFVMASKVTLLAVGGGLFPLYWKQLQAGYKNYKAQGDGYDLAGIWRCKVIHASVDQQFSSPNVSQPAYVPEPSLRLLIGDDGLDSFTSELQLPWASGSQGIAPGDEVEILVLSKTLDFSAFKVLRELYLPHRGIWLSDYPFVKRNVFQTISADIEYSRRQPGTW